MRSLLGQRLGSRGTCHVRDLLLDDRAVDVVDAEHRRELRDLEADHDPERLDVRDVVEHQPRDRERLEVVEAGRARQVLHLGVGRMEGERDEREEAAGLVLLLAQSDQVVDALLGVSMWP